MSRLLIALAAVLLIGAALTSPSEAQGSWTCVYNFANGAQSWTAQNGYGTLSGSAWATNDALFAAESRYVRGIWIAQNLGGVTLTSISVSFSLTKGNYTGTPGMIDIIRPGVEYVQRVLSNESIPSSPYTWTGSKSGVNTLGIYISANYFASASYAGSASISFITLGGTGTAPSSCPATPTPTYTPSITPTATNTPLPTNTPTPTHTPIAYPTPGAFVASSNDSYWGNTYNMAYGLQGWSLISGMLGAGRVVSANVSGTQRLEMEYPLGNVKLTDFFANYEATCPHTFEVKDGNTVFESGSVGTGMQALVWQGEHVVNNGSVRLSLVGSPSCGVSAFQLTEITLMGYGENPTGLRATAVALDTGNIWSGLQEANAMVNSLPPNMAAAVPAETGRTLFGYVKWLVSPSSADEIAGPFAPMLSHMGFALLLIFGAAAIYAIVWGLVWVLKFVVWLFQWVLKLVDLVLQIAQVIGNAIGGLLKFI
jgi:hypothetical protein